VAVNSRATSSCHAIKQRHGRLRSHGRAAARVWSQRRVPAGNWQGLYGWSFAHSVRIDKDDNIWAIDKGSE